MKTEYAKYSEAILPEYKDNPFVLALPKKLSDEKVIELLSFYPEVCKSTISKESHIRQEYLVRLDQLVQPLPEYLTAFRYIERALKESYSSKNPLSPTTASYLHYLDYQDLPTQPSSGVFTPKGTSISIIGESGIGKSKMLTKILSYYPQVIQHDKFKGESLNIKQLLWLKVDCPHDASIRGLCHSILNRIGECTGTKYKPNREIAILLDQIEILIRSTFLGVLVIDEIQNLNLAKAGGSKKFLSFLLKLINESGVVIVFCGNPEIAEIFSETFRNARRAESGGYIEMDKIRGPMWDIFIDELWYLQWTSESTPITAHLSNKLYELSDGIIDIAIRTFKEAQELAIGSDSEIITEELLVSAYQKACPLTKKLMAPEPPFESVNLLARKKKTNKPLEASSSEIKKVPKLATPKKTTLTEINRCPHDEFSEKCIELILHPSLKDIIVFDNLFIEASIEDIPQDKLTKNNLMLDDPLSEFGYEHL
jgi:hypothetical protein